MSGTHGNSDMRSEPQASADELDRLRSTFAAARAVSESGDSYAEVLGLALLRDSARLVLAGRLGDGLAAAERADLELLEAFASRPELVTPERVARMRGLLDITAQILERVAGSKDPLERQARRQDPDPEPEPDPEPGAESNVETANEQPCPTTPIREVVDVPTLLDNSLTRLRIESVEDLLNLTLDRARTTPGIGRTKIRHLRDLMAQAHERFGTTVPAPNRPASLRAQLEQAGVPGTTRTLDLLRRLSTRARNTVTRCELDTIGALADACERGSLRAMEGVGSGSEREFKSAIRQILQVGPDTYVYGSGGRPVAWRR